MIEEIQNINTEIRYMTLELMKIAARRKVKFETVAKEFFKNANTLHNMLYKNKIK